ncbi:SUF system Fe-S cluster assembly protein [candidate division KSB1 bacterium]|nr:SUF system Fe-S cluster assembly protein [candidate division KSB1 bacterium]RQW01276.1 MAG: SUF system Fe-S cluster assembly protein [candidate division KSB1 bacterium]
MDKELSLEDLHQEVIETIRMCYDPEIPVNIYDLGLVYEIDVNEHGEVKVVMTLTSPMCPVAESLPLEVQYRVEEIEEVQKCAVEVVWDPPWTPDMMSEEARLELNMM